MGVWRLKIGEGANNPYLTSTNNFVGRQTWVFEPDGGTPEERDQVEEARQNYFKNRFRVRPCSDLLWQMQVIKRCHNDLYSFLWFCSDNRYTCPAANGNLMIASARIVHVSFQATSFTMTDTLTFSPPLEPHHP
uniref:Taraxerol synthase n=1 Tax=Rhizophora mucronata TaxID=61149 RepID=A0A2P2MRW1_RHIMU